MAGAGDGITHRSRPGCHSLNKGDREKGEKAFKQI